VSGAAIFTLDGRQVPAKPGETIIEAADAAGVYIPRLCHKPGLQPHGGCRICTVKANGRMVAACTFPASDGMIVESDTEELNAHRSILLEMLFVEGNHFCMFCEKSGNCELQALGYRFAIAAPRFPLQFPVRGVDASHPDVLIDGNRCILCARCVRTSRDLDKKNVFGFVGRGPRKRLAVSSGTRLRDTEANVTDLALESCPVGALLKKRVGFAVPVGRRLYDKTPIGSELARVEREPAPQVAPEESTR
jgi:[NiFe] hydrogenase diaphorase moiety small subunit